PRGARWPRGPRARGGVWWGSGRSRVFLGGRCRAAVAGGDGGRGLVGAVRDEDAGDDGDEQLAVGTDRAGDVAEVGDVPHDATHDLVGQDRVVVRPVGVAAGHVPGLVTDPDADDAVGHQGRVAGDRLEGDDVPDGVGVLGNRHHQVAGREGRLHRPGEDGECGAAEDARHDRDRDRGDEQREEEHRGGTAERGARHGGPLGGSSGPGTHQVGRDRDGGGHRSPSSSFGGGTGRARRPAPSGLGQKPPPGAPVRTWSRETARSARSAAAWVRTWSGVSSSNSAVTTTVYSSGPLRSAGSTGRAGTVWALSAAAKRTPATSAAGTSVTSATTWPWRSRSE